MTEVLFVVASCSHQHDEGAWPQLAEFVEQAQPRFLILMGDQVYMDPDGGPEDVWAQHLRSESLVRRRAMMSTYLQNWSRDPVRKVLANLPTYMMWDDHEIRDGWGSFAADSPTLAARYPRGAPIATRYNAYFEDARDVYWHFQMCRNPLAESLSELPNFIDQPPLPGQRRAMPFAFRCGRTVVLMIDSRGARDLWREVDPVLGTEQWTFIDSLVADLPLDVEALVVVTPAPIVSASPTGQMQLLIGQRTDDVDLFQRGDSDALSVLMAKSSETILDLAEAALGGWSALNFGGSANLGAFKVGDIDDVRDAWSHHFSRREQERLIRMAGVARRSNRIAALPREVIFIGGDIHIGAMFDISVSTPPFLAQCLITSGISQKPSTSLLIGTIVDQEFEVVEGISASLKNVVDDYNFGLVQVVPTGGIPVVSVALNHAGASSAVGAQVGFGV